LLLPDAVAAGQELEELVLVLIDGADVLELDELVEGIATRWRDEAAIHQVDEAFPGLDAMIAL
jgi:hypothetical protein